MSKREINKQELLLAINKHQKQLKEDFERIRIEINNLDLEKCMGKVFEEAKERFFEEDLLRNKERNRAINSLKEDWKKYEEAKYKIEQTKTYGHFFSQITIPYWEKALIQTFENLKKRTKEIETNDERTLSTDLAKRYIETYSQMRLPNVPEFQEFMKLENEQHRIDTEITILDHLATNIKNDKERDKFFVEGDIGNYSNFMKRISNINMQLNNFNVSICEFEDAVYNHLKELGAEYQQSLDKVVNLSKEITKQIISEKHKNYLKDNKIVDYGKIKVIKNFQEKIEKTIENGHFERLPSEISIPIKNTPEYQSLIQINKEKSTLEYYKSLISKINNPEQRINIRGTSLNDRKAITEFRDEIGFQLKTIIANRNLPNNDRSKKFDM